MIKPFINHLSSLVRSSRLPALASGPSPAGSGGQVPFPIKGDGQARPERSRRNEGDAAHLNPPPPPPAPGGRKLLSQQRGNQAAAADLSPFSSVLGAGTGWAMSEYGEYYATSVSGT